MYIKRTKEEKKFIKDYNCTNSYINYLKNKNEGMYLKQDRTLNVKKVIKDISNRLLLKQEVINLVIGLKNTDIMHLFNGSTYQSRYEQALSFMTKLFQDENNILMNDLRYEALKNMKDKLICYHQDKVDAESN